MVEERDVKALLRKDSPWQILAFQEVGSTMEVARQLADKGHEGQVVVVADRQTSGSGRFDRPWHSPSGGLWMTVLLRPTVAPERAAWFTLASAVAVVEALALLGLPAGIKWPNDVLAASKACWRKKLCGIRAEMDLNDAGLDWVSLGIGLNVCECKFPPELAPIAASLEELGGVPVRRESVMAAVLERLEENCRLLEEGEFFRVREAWLSRALGLGEEVVLRDVDGEVRGTAVGLDDDGCLLVQRAQGEKPYPVLSGDLIFRV